MNVNEKQTIQDATIPEVFITRGEKGGRLAARVSKKRGFSFRHYIVSVRKPLDGRPLSLSHSCFASPFCFITIR